MQTDVNNYLRFDVYFDGSTQRMFAASFVNNNPTVRAAWPSAERKRLLDSSTADRDNLDG